MEGNCVTCSDSNGEKLCQIKLKELIVDYDENKNTDIEFAIIGENFGGRLLQYHQLDTLEVFLKVNKYFLLYRRLYYDVCFKCDVIISVLRQIRQI